MAQLSSPPRQTWRDLIRDSYLVFDRRTLGVTRVLLAFYLIMDLLRRTPDWEHMFGDKGVLPTWVILSRPQAQNFTLLHGFTSAPELWALWGVVLATYVMLLVGWRTKIWQVLALLFVTSMNGRVLLIENGGYVVQNLLLLWTAFLPLGDRFSLDSLLASLRRRQEASAADLADRPAMDDPARIAPHHSIAGMAIMLQLSAIYYFNVVHKTGAAWHNGTAVHFVLYNDRMATPIVAAVREHIPFWFIKVATPTVLVMEAMIPFCLLLPRLQLAGLEVKTWLTRLAIVLICALHIIFGSSFVLGPFAWALCIFSTLLFSRADWEVAIPAMRRASRERTVIFDPQSGALLLASRILARLDRLTLLGFAPAETAEERREGLSVLRPSGEVVTGWRAVRDVVAALPLGPIFAWIIALPGISHAVDAALLAGRGRVSRWLGLAGPRPDAARVLEVAPATRRGRRVRAWVREGLCLVMFAAGFNQALTELWSTKKPWQAFVTSLNQTGPAQTVGVTLSPHPEVMRTLTHKLRFLQGWFMFSPNPVMDDGTVVVDAITTSGRHVDPFWNEPPEFDFVHVKSCRYNQIWSDYFNRMHFAGNRAYGDAMVDYMRRLPERTGNPEDALVSGEVYWVSDMNPRWGTRTSWNEQRELLFTFGPTGGAVQPPAAVASR